MAVNNAESSPMSFFAHEVQEARTAKGLTVRDLARKIPCGIATISRIENCQQAPSLAFVEAMDRIFPERGGWFTRFYNDQQGWEVGDRRWFAPWREFEQAATCLRWWEPLQVPGLLQTEEYATILIRSWMPDGEDLAREDIARRVSRQSILHGEQPASLLALLDHGVLHRDIGGADVMARQLDHLIEMNAQPNVMIQVVRGTGLAGLSGAFVIAERGTASVAAYWEGSVQGTTEQEPTLLIAAARLFDHLRSLACPIGESTGLLMEARERWSQRQ